MATSQQILFALERAEARLRAEAAKLLESHDYSAEFPAADAAMLAEARGLIASATPKTTHMVSTRGLRVGDVIVRPEERVARITPGPTPNSRIVYFVGTNDPVLLRRAHFNLSCLFTVTRE